MPAHFVCQHEGPVRQHDALRITNRVRGEDRARRVKVDEETGRRDHGPFVGDRVVDRAFVREQELEIEIRVLAPFVDHAAVGQYRLRRGVRDKRHTCELRPRAVDVTTVQIGCQLEDPTVADVLYHDPAIREQQRKSGAARILKNAVRVDNVRQRRRIRERLPRAGPCEHRRARYSRNPEPAESLNQ